LRVGERVDEIAQCRVAGGLQGEQQAWATLEVMCSIVSSMVPTAAQSRLDVD